MYYADTDSVVLAATSDDLEDCLEPGKEEKYRLEKGTVFADESSPLAQSGLLKREFLVMSRVDWPIVCIFLFSGR